MMNHDFSAVLGIIFFSSFMFSCFCLGEFMAQFAVARNVRLRFYVSEIQLR